MKDLINWLRNLDIRKVAFCIGFCMLIEKGIVDGEAPLAGLGFSAPAIAIVVAWCKLLLWVNGIVLVGHTTSAVRWPTPQNPKINNMAALVLFFGASLLAILVLTGAPAKAGDITPAPIVAKAPGAPATTGFQYPYDTSGFYAGVGTLGGGGSVSVNAPGVNTNSLVSNQIGVFGMFGYAWNIANSPMFMAIDQLIGYTDFNGAQQGLSYHGPVDFETRFIVGAPIDQIVAFFPNFGIKMPTFNMPTGFTAKSSKFYLGGALHVSDVSLNFGAAQARDWAVSPTLIPAGIRTLLTNGSAVDAWTEVRFNDQSLCIQSGGVGQNACGRPNTELLAGLAYEFGVLGLSAK